MNFKGSLSAKLAVLLIMWGLIWPLPLHAQDQETEAPLEAASEVSSIALERPFWVAIRIKVAEGEFTPYVDQESGDRGVHIGLELPEGFEKGETLLPVPSRLEDDTGFGYKKAFWVLQEIIPTKKASFNESFQIHGWANWGACGQITCDDQMGNFSFELPYGQGLSSVTSAEVFSEARAALPKLLAWPATYYAGGGTFRLEIYAGPESWNLREAIIILNQGKMLVDLNEALTIQDDRGILVFEGRPAGFLPRSTLEGLLFVPGLEDEAFVLDVENDFVTERPVELSAPGFAGFNLGLAFFFAFIGGLILNLMPCVFPVLTLKIFGLVKAGSTSKKALRLDGLAYTAGILMAFAFIGLLLLTFREMGDQIGWGFQLQSPLFVLGMSLLLLAVTFNFLGLFEIRLPMVIDGSTKHEGALGSFYTGLLATAVASPCTAPFMAPALGFALTLDTAGALLVFTGLGLGLAFPYLLVSFIPGIVRIFPKPGPWMVTFKKILAIPLALTVGWLLWVLHTQVGTAGLVYFGGLALAMALTIFIARTFKHKPLVRGGVLGLLIITFVFGGYFANERLIPVSSTQKNFESQVWSDDEVWNLRLQGRGVFVNYTAAWCLTCLVNEKLVFNSEKFQRFLSENNIVYMRADWTNYDPKIAKSLEKLGRTALPVYVYYPTGGPTREPVLLPEILSLEETLEILTANK